MESEEFRRVVARGLGLTPADLERMIRTPIDELPSYNSFKAYHNRLAKKRRIPLCDETIIDVPY